MTDLKQAARQALEALNEYCEHGAILEPFGVITALRRALEQQPADEPAAYIRTDMHGDVEFDWDRDEDLDGSMYEYVPLYTRPQPAAPQRSEDEKQWVGLTVDEVFDLTENEDWYNTPERFVKIIEATLREKNGK